MIKIGKGKNGVGYERVVREEFSEKVTLSNLEDEEEPWGKEHSRLREQNKSRPVSGNEHAVLGEVKRQVELEPRERGREGCKVKLESKLVAFQPH